MKTPTEFELDQLMHIINPAVQAYNREYYLRNRKLKGRKKGGSEVHTYEDGSSDIVTDFRAKNRARNNNGLDPRSGKTFEQIHKEAVAKQRAALTERVKRLEGRLVKLEALIRKKESAEARENRKAVADKNTAAKERDDPKTAAEKAEIARENKKYRDKNQQKIKSAEKKSSSSKSGGSSSSSSSSGESSSSGASLSDLRSLATKVKGQIAVAKQKIAAL